MGELRVEGVKVGHATDLEAATGCTAILLPPETTAGVAVPGKAPATRETDVLRPGRRVRFVHAVVLTGGSAYGLDVAGGVMRVLESRGIGHQTPVGLVPIVPTASIFDLGIGRADVRPGLAEGMAAAEAASAERIEGVVGGATGATCGKYAGLEHMTKTGFGIASTTHGDATIEAFAVCNAVGDIIAADRSMLAGSRAPDALVRRDALIAAGEDAASWLVPVPEATTIACLATDAILDPKACTDLAAAVAERGFGASLTPPGTLWDGDTLFLCATNRVEADLGALEQACIETLATAIRRCAVTGAPLAGVPAA